MFKKQAGEQMNINLCWNHSLLSPSVSCQPAALEEEEEGEDEGPTAKLKKTVDEAEDKKEEEYDEDEDEEKATVDVIKPVPEPEDEAPKTEPAGQRSSIEFITFPFSLT